MIRYILKRIVQLLPVLAVMSLVVFTLTNILPGDPTVTVLGENASTAQREQLRLQLGLDQPIYVQFVRWAAQAATGNLGLSLQTGQPVTQMLAQRIPVTIELTLLSIVFAVLVGIPAGMLAARFRNTWIDLVVGFVALVGVAMPFFWMGILLVRAFSLALGWLPPSGYTPITSDIVGNLAIMIMPTITVGSTLAALIMRQTRTAMLQVISQDFIRTARAKGASELKVYFAHGLHNSLLPVVTVIGLQTGALLGGAVVTETIFALPGLGSMLVSAIFQRDFAVVQGAVLLVVLFVLVVNLLTDLSYALLDPRIRY